MVFGQANASESVTSPLRLTDSHKCTTLKKLPVGMKTGLAPSHQQLENSYISTSFPSAARRTAPVTLYVTRSSDGDMELTKSPSAFPIRPSKNCLILVQVLGTLAGVIVGSSVRAYAARAVSTANLGSDHIFPATISYYATTLSTKTSEARCPSIDFCLQAFNNSTIVLVLASRDSPPRLDGGYRFDGLILRDKGSPHVSALP